MAATNLVLATALGLIQATSAAAADWSGYASIGSDYVYRGVSLLDSGPSLQGGVEGRFDGVFVAGAAAARIDRQWLYYARVPNRLQPDLYTGADFGCGEHCRARLLVSRYEFPGAGARDWSEATASLALFDRVGAAYSWSPHGLGSRERTRTVETWLQQPLSRSTSVEVGYGRLWIGDLDYWYAHLGASHRIDRFVIDLSEQWSDPKLRRFLIDDHSRRLVLTISTGF